MKTLEELGISPAPWKVAHWYEKTTGKPYSNINTASGFYVADGTSDADKNLIAAAPELYEALRDATYEYCHACENGRGNCPKKDGDCFVQKWRAALAKASGESEVRHA